MSGHEKLWGTITNSGERRRIDVTFEQGVRASTSNNSVTNLNPNETWYGIAETTLGIVGIQVNFASNVIVKIEVQQSMDGTNWDIIDNWIVDVDIDETNSMHGRIVQATASFFRIKLVNLTNTRSTFLRLQVALCPVVEALPRALTQDGNLKVAIKENIVGISNYGGAKQMSVYCPEIMEALVNVVTQLKIANIHLAELSETTVDLGDEKELEWRS
jgi:hypothetical protein